MEYCRHPQASLIKAKRVGFDAAVFSSRIAPPAHGAGKKVVGMTVWETETLQAHCPETLNRMDALVVPCHWNREVFLANGITRPIGVVPLVHQILLSTIQR